MAARAAANRFVFRISDDYVLNVVNFIVLRVKCMIFAISNAQILIK